MRNEQMIAGRFERWHAARVKVAKIQAHLQSGGVVVIVNHMKAIYFKKASQASMFKATKTGAYMQSGKSWLCFDGNGVKFGRYTD